MSALLTVTLGAVAGLAVGAGCTRLFWYRAQLLERKESARLKELLSLKDEYVAKVSHELRTPLTAIKEGISLVLDGSLGTVNDEQRDFLKTADEGIERLAELINNILDLAKIEAGRLRLVRKKLELGAVVNSLLNSYRMVAGSRRVEFNQVPVPDVFADPNRIMQVVGNLFSNAVKFTPPEGSIRVSICQEGDHVAVSVADTGSGIAPEDVSKLFQKFSQVGGGQTRLRGTGLGLALCKELIELHGGLISVRSELGRGSLFTFKLPVFTPKLALEESFEELSEFANSSGPGSLGVLVLDIAADVSEGAQQSATPSERLAETVRRRVQQGDIVLAVGAERVVVLAIAEPNGIEAMASRLAVFGQSASSRFSCGWAVAPADGTEIHALVERARARVENCPARTAEGSENG